MMEIQVGDKVRVLNGAFNLDGGYHFIPCGEVVEVVETVQTKVAVVFTGVDATGDLVEALRQIVHLKDIEKV